MHDAEDMNAWQETIYDLVFRRQVVPPKAIALRLHRHSDYLSDICRRERVDPVAVLNAILQEAEHYDQQRRAAVALPILGLLLNGTRWFAVHAGADDSPLKDVGDLRDQIAPLLSDLSGAVDSLCAIARDGRIDAADDPSIAEFDAKVNRLTRFLADLGRSIHAARAGATS